MRLAILGGGFAGLAVAWFVLHYTRGTAKIDLFDPQPIGSGASGLSSGLLHPFAGKQAHKSWEADACIKETHRLITEASRSIGEPLILSRGILRPALSATQIADFKRTAAENPENQWWDASTCEEKIPGLRVPAEGGGLFIPQGLTLNAKAYLEGLWQACALLGTQHYQQAFSKEDIEDYDRVLIAMGPQTKNFPPLKNLPLTAVKGQVIDLRWPVGTPPLPFSLISQKYLVMHPDHKGCTLGATFEHDFTSAAPDQEVAVHEILPKVGAFFPAVLEAEILGVRAGFRASSTNHLPLIGRVNEQFYFFTGLGSKGLLYHAWVGKHVARALLTNDPVHLPSKLLFHPS